MEFKYIMLDSSMDERERQLVQELKKPDESLPMPTVKSQATTLKQVTDIFDSTKDAIIVIALFVLFASPLTPGLIEKVEFFKEKPYINLAVRALMAGAIFWIVKKWIVK